MAGYFRMPDKTVEAWRSLWFHTGDAGYFDAQGRLFYVDRIRDRIRRRGENISAYEVEEVIGAHPNVRQCAVIGVKVTDAGGEDESKSDLRLMRARAQPQDLTAARAARSELGQFIAIGSPRTAVISARPRVR
jgi:acyl-CoA synthetase (AMP-forming)/AMP-acid ligase II